MRDMTISLISVVCDAYGGDGKGNTQPDIPKNLRKADRGEREGSSGIRVVSGCERRHVVKQEVETHH